MEPIIQSSSISKSFKSRTNKNLITGLYSPRWSHFEAVKKVSFSVMPGESVAFLGPNGAGKTTTTKMMTGLVHPTAGELTVLGYNPFKRDKEFLRKIGLVMGNKAGLNWDLTANQSFWLLKHIYSISDADFGARVSTLSAMLKVEGKLDTQVRRLSLGERMKLELIAAILHQPEILFLDEPTIGLDIESKKSVRAFLRTIQKDFGTTIVLTSHDMDDVEEVSDRVLIINNGSIAYDDSMSALTRKYGRSKYMRVHFKDTPSTESLGEIGKIVNRDNGTLFKIEKSKLGRALSLLTENFDVDDMNIESTPLETIIAGIFKKS